MRQPDTRGGSPDRPSPWPQTDPDAWHPTHPCKPSIKGGPRDLMTSYRRAASSIGLLAVAGLVAGIGASSLLVSAADHLDAPTTKANHRIDITDLYAFKSNGGTTLVLNVNPLTSPADSKLTRFDTNAIYQFNIDRNLNGVADMAYRVKFSNTRVQTNGKVIQHYTIKRSLGASARSNAWSGTVVATGETTTYKRSSLRVAHVSGGGKAFAGVRDDPFFFDLPGFVEFKKQLLAGSTDIPTLLGGFTGVDTSRAPKATRSPTRGPTNALAAPGRRSVSGEPCSSRATGPTSKSSGWAARPSTPCSTTRPRRRKRRTASAPPMTERSTRTTSSRR